MISEKLASVYTKIEDKYFNALDFLDARGLPVYAYSDFFENKGIPSFVVTVAIIIAILVVISLAFAVTTTVSNQLTLNLKDASGNALQGVTIKVLDEQGNVIFGPEKKNDGDTITLLGNLPQGAKIKVLASKDGFQPISFDTMIGMNGTTARISLDGAFEGINAKLILYDSETNTKITSATVLVTYNSTSYQFQTDTNGTFTKGGVPANTTVLLNITADGYTAVTNEPITFVDDSPKSYSLTPSTASFVGNASVLILVSDANTVVIPGAKVMIYNKQNKQIIAQSETSAQGSVTAALPAGIPLQIIVEKAGYLNYDSDKTGAGSITIRKQEERINIEMERGGKRLSVNVLGPSGLSIDGAAVQVFGTDGLRIASATTTIDGAIFEGLDPESTVLVTAYIEGYLPSQKVVEVGSTENVVLILDEASSDNSMRLDIFTIDGFAQPIGAAALTIYQYVDGNKLPAGYDSALATSVLGYANVVVRTGTTYEINAETEVMQGQKTIEVKKDMSDNKVYIDMKKKAKIVEMKFLTPTGSDVEGTATVSALDGATLYDGNINSSRIFFNAENRDVVEVVVNLPDGNLFTENVTVKGKDYVEVVVYNKEGSALSPTIEFVGLENEAGEAVQGVTPGAFYWAKFSVAFPMVAERGGVHFRAGSDSINTAESDNFALFELNLQGSTATYGYTYTPLPTPGNETIDRSNASNVGEVSKWTEGVIVKPAGTYIAKVKIRASDYHSGKVQLRYRAWASIGSDYYRAPEDAELANKSFSVNKSGLYAETALTEFNLYESLPECDGNICLTTNFIDSDEKFYDTTGFEALKDKTYALEAEISSVEGDYLQITANSDYNVVFLGTQAGTFSFLTGELLSQAQEASLAVSLTANSKQKVRFYFAGKQVGAAAITLNIVGKGTITKDVQFNVVQEKTMLVELSEQNILLGKNFTVKVTDQSVKGIENALVKINDKQGKTVKSVAGDASDGKGKSGNYRITNDLPVGLYEAEVQATGYATQKVPFIINTKEILSITESVEAKIPIGQKSIVSTVTLTNNSEFSVNDITYETDSSDKFVVTPAAVPSIGKGQKQVIQINVEYIGASESDSANEAISIKVKGFVEGKFLTTVSTTVNASYNQKLDPSCLKFAPTSVSINLLGSNGASDTGTFTVTNNCDQPVVLAKSVKAKNTRSPVIVDAEDIALDMGEKKDITVTATNRMDLQMSRDTSYSFEISYDSNYVSKKVSVSVRLVNASLSLSCPGQIVLWLSQNSAAAKAQAAQPIFITNVSNFPVENVSFSVEKDGMTGGSITPTIEPPGSVNLAPRQSIMPPKLVFASSSSKVTEPVNSTIIVRGKLGELNNNSGQRDTYGTYYDQYSTQAKNIKDYSSASYYSSGSDTLCAINVITYYSGFECLKASVDDALEYNLSIEGLQMGKRINIENQCAEPIRVTGISSQSRDVFFSVPIVVINPSEGATVPMTAATLKGSLNLKNYPVYVNAITSVSQTMIQSNSLAVSVTAGQNANETYSKSVKGLEARLCDTPDSSSTIKVDVPKVAPQSSTDCANSYCDAKQASKYITSKIKAILTKAQSQAYSKSGKSDKSSDTCMLKGVCKFSNLGISPESFDLYLQNDTISVGTFSDQFSQVSGGNTGMTSISGQNNSDYLISIDQINDMTLSAIAQTGYGRQILIDSAFSGCGYYKVKIDGAFTASGGAIQFDSPVIAISALPLNEGNKRILTKECTSSVTNLANFNPIDEGYTVADDKGTWLTSVETSDPILKEIAVEIAKGHLKAEERASSGYGNKITLTQSAQTNMLAEVCLSAGLDKAITTVKINSSIAQMKEAERSTFSKSVAKMIISAISGSFGKNCLVKSGDGYSCVRLNDTTGISELKMNLPQKTIKLTPKIGCVEGTVTSSTFEELNFDVEPTENAGKMFAGIQKVTIEDITPLSGSLSSTSSSGNSTPATNPPSNGPQGTNNSSPTPATSSPTNALATQNVGQVAGGIIYEKVFNVISGPLVGTATIDKALPLTRNTTTSANDARYFKKLRICAYPGELGAPSTHEQAGSSIYAANGAMFIVTAKNKKLGTKDGTKEEDGKILISAGTLHPDDLLALLKGVKGADKVKAMGESNPYYFTINWKDSANILPLADYMTAQTLYSSGELSKGLVKTEAQGMLNTDDYLTKSSSARTSALLSYMGACVAASEACNAVGNIFIASGWVMAPIMDCVVPGLLIFKDDFAKQFSAMKSIYGFLDKITFGFLDLFKTDVGTDASLEKSWASIGTGIAKGTGTSVAIQAAITGTRIAGGMNQGVIKMTADLAQTQYEEIATKTVDKMATGLTPTQKTDMAKRLKEFMTKTYTEELTSNYAKDIERAGWGYAGDFKSLKADTIAPAITKAHDVSVSTDTLKKFLEAPSAAAGSPTNFDVIKGGTAGAATDVDSLLGRLGGTTKGAIGTAINPYEDAKLAATIEAKIGKYGSAIFDDKGALITVEKTVSSVVPKNTVVTYINPVTGVPSTYTTTVDETVNKIVKTPMTLVQVQPSIDGMVDEAVTDALKGTTLTTPTAKADLINAVKTDITNQVRTASGRTGLTKASLATKIKSSILANKGLAVPTVNASDIVPKLTEEMAKVAKANGGDDLIGKLDTSVKARGFKEKLTGTLKSSNLWKSVGKGLVCGTVANLAGIHFYNSTLNSKTQQILADTACPLNYELIQGETYRMVLEPDPACKTKPTITLVSNDTPELQKEMNSALSDNSKDARVKATWLTYEGLNDIIPEERVLLKYCLTANTNEIRAGLVKDNFFSASEQSVILGIIKDPKSQTIICNYTPNKQGIASLKVASKDGTVNASEAMVGALIYAMWGEKEFDQTKEALNQSTYIRDYMQKIVDEIAKNKDPVTGKAPMTEAMANSIFKSSDKAKKFIHVLNPWADTLGTKGTTITPVNPLAPAATK